MDEKWVTGIRYLNMAEMRNSEILDADCRLPLPVSDVRVLLADL